MSNHQSETPAASPSRSPRNTPDCQPQTETVKQTGGHQPAEPTALPPGTGIMKDLKRSIDLLIREMGRIQQSLARIESRLNPTPAPSEEMPHWQAINRHLVEIKERVTREAISSARERRDLQKTLAGLQEQADGLRDGKRLAARLPREVPEQQQRVGVFVDVQNIFYAAKQFNARLDFEKLIKAAVGRRRLIRAIAYVVQSPEVDQSGFISMLQQKSYEVRRKDLRLRSDGSAKGDWDMGMAIDIMGLVDKLDVVVLVTGDGDFVSLVNLVKTIGPRVEVISFLHNTARDLVQSADAHMPIEEALLMRLEGNGNSGHKGHTPESQTRNGHNASAPSRKNDTGT